MARRILLIEDETSALHALGSLLTEDGYEVCTATTGRAGLERLHDFRPDAVVCDFFLPDLDGLQVLRRTRAMAQNPVVFILITAGCGGVEAEAELRREADFFFQKPLDLARFRRVLRHYAPASGPPMELAMRSTQP
jgi:DNA-binding response OmpR family regulator